MITIALKRARWRYDPQAPLGPPGGFGAVFQGEDEAGSPVAVKQLKVSATDAGHRESDIATELVGKEYRHVIPILDDGLDAESERYYVVMARAESSLADRLQGGPLPEAEAVEVLSQIARGLLEASSIVHRDLKPANVLRQDGAWKIADFGIARFVEESTSAHTLKEYLTPDYAAPEQWRLERATHKTDVYALGCLGFHLLAGHPPFRSDDLMRAHLEEPPPRPPASDSRLQTTILQCLMKVPEARPALEEVARHLDALVSPPDPVQSLADVGARIAADEAARAADLAGAQSEERRRRALAKDASSGLQHLVDQLFSVIETSTPAARRCGCREMRLGCAAIRTTLIFPDLAPCRFPRWGKDVVCGALMLLFQKADGPPACSANLWYMDDSGSYGWWECSYRYRVGVGRHYDHQPFGIADNAHISDADLAGSSASHTVTFADAPERADGPGVDAFIARWAKRLAEAAS